MAVVEMVVEPLSDDLADAQQGGVASSAAFALSSSPTSTVETASLFAKKAKHDAAASMRMRRPQKQPKQKNTQQQRRRVQFRVDDDNRILPQVVIFERSATAMPAKNDLFWTLQEQLKARQRAKNQGKVIRSKYAEEVHALENLYYCDSDDPTMLQVTESNNTSNLTSMLLEKRDMELLQAWAGSYARGLEDSVSSLFRIDKRKAKNIFLNYQDYLRQGTYSSSSSESMEEALYVCSIRVSHRAREFATKLAHGDALALL